MALTMRWNDQDALDKAEKNSNITLGFLATIPVLLFTILFSLCFGKKKTAPTIEAIKKEDLVTADDAPVVKEESEEEQEQAGEIEKEGEVGVSARRRPRRDS